MHYKIQGKGEREGIEKKKKNQQILSGTKFLKSYKSVSMHEVNW